MAGTKKKQTRRNKVDLETSFLSTAEDILDEICECAEWCDSWRFCVAYASAANGNSSNWLTVKPYLQKLDIAIVGLSGHATEPWLLYELNKLGVLRVVASASGIFHPKIYLFQKGEESSVIVGSANFTCAAFKHNIECATRTDSSMSSPFFSSIRTFFDKCMRTAQMVNTSQINEYEEHYFAKQAGKNHQLQLTTVRLKPTLALPDPNLFTLTNSNQIRMAEIALANNFRHFMTSYTKETISFPSGSDVRDVMWYENIGIWACFWDVGDRYFNSFGTVKPDGKKHIKITAEINVPASGINAKCQGAFAIDEFDSSLWMVHRGKVGGGKKGITKQAFLQSLEWNMTQLNEHGGCPICS